MEISNPHLVEPDFPSATSVRRFWTAWLVTLLAMLAGVIVVILIAAVNAEPASIPPAG